MIKLKKNKNKSFSLLELIISLGIFVLIIVLIWNWQKNVFSTNDLMMKSLTIQNNLRKTIKNFVSELRTAQSAENGAYLIEQAAKDKIIFFSDLDYDGQTERIRYFAENGKIKKGVTKATGQPPVYQPINESVYTLIENLTNQDNQIFLYYNKNYDGTGEPLDQPVEISDIRLVKITITVDENPDRPPMATTETSQALIRNLKDNF